MTEKIDFLTLMTGVTDKKTNDFWFDDKQFKFIPHKLLVPPHNVDLSLVYPEDELDDLPFVYPEDELDEDDLSLAKKNTDYTKDDSEDLDYFVESLNDNDFIGSSNDSDENDDYSDENDDYSVNDIDTEKVNRLSVREVTVRFVHGSIVDSIMNSNMDNEAKWKTIRMLDTVEAHIVKSDNLSAKASTRWDDWAYNLEKLNSHINGYTVLKNFEGHLYPSPSRDVLNNYDIVEFKIINLPDVEFLPFNG